MIPKIEIRLLITSGFDNILDVFFYFVPDLVKMACYCAIQSLSDRLALRLRVYDALFIGNLSDQRNYRDFRKVNNLIPNLWIEIGFIQD